MSQAMVLWRVAALIRVKLESETRIPTIREDTLVEEPRAVFMVNPVPESDVKVTKMLRVLGAPLPSSQLRMPW